MSSGITAPPYKIPPGAASGWDTYLEGTHIAIEPGPGGPRVWTFTAAAAITAGQYVELNSTSYVIVGQNDSVVGAGVATESAASGAHVPVMINGLAVVTAGSSIGAGAQLGSAGSGKVKAIGSDVPSKSIGFAFTAAGADGDKIIAYIGRS